MYVSEHRFDSEGHCRYCDMHLSAASNAVCSERVKRAERNKRQRENRNAMRDAMESLGLVRVRVNGRQAWE
jgi:hypothetical protein